MRLTDSASMGRISVADANEDMILIRGCFASTVAFLLFSVSIRKRMIRFYEKEGRFIPPQPSTVECATNVWTAQHGSKYSDNQSKKKSKERR
jgi:hypothetical protein